MKHTLGHREYNNNPNHWITKGIITLQRILVPTKQDVNRQTHKITLTLPLSLWHKVQQLVQAGYAPDTDYFIRMAIDLWIDEIIRHKAEEGKR